MTTYGHRPAASGENGPYAYFDTPTDDLGISGGAGLYNYNSDRPDVKGGASAGFVNGGVGQFNDINGERTYGAGVQGGLYKGDIKRDGAPLGGEFGVGTFQGGLFINKNTASLGMQANAAEIAAKDMGTKQHNMRIGLSAGTGWGGRIHYGDADGNNVPEVGYGFDCGPMSFDIKSELPSRIAMGLDSWLRKPTPMFDPDADNSTGTGGVSGGGGTSSSSGTKPGGMSGGTQNQSPIDGHSGGEALPPSNILLNVLPSMPDGGVISNARDLLPSIPSLPSLPSMPDGGLTSVLPFGGLF